jgi:uncharacterized protein YjbI with pentapeptide repeats
VDGFYDAPERVRAVALQSAYANIELTDYPGFASRSSLSTKALQARFQEILGESIIVDANRFTWGGFRFVTAETGSRPMIHADAATEWAAMVYLTPNAPEEAGTGFFRHTSSGLSGPPSEREARALGFADSSAFDDAVIRPDKSDLSKWTLIRQVAPKFNRLIMFRGASLYHAPLGGCGSRVEDARLAHIFFFNTVQRWPRGRKVASGHYGGGARPLLAALAAHVGISYCAGTLVLVPAVPSELSSEGGEAIARRAIDSGSLFHTAAELAQVGTDLAILLLIELDKRGRYSGWRAIDGHAFLREAGSGVDLTGAYLRGASLAGAQLGGCDLSEADLQGADLSKADLSQAKLVGAELAGASLFTASLLGADLREADLSRTDLRHTDLRRANCARTAFRGADLWNAYTWEARLDDAFTEGADFSRADDLSGALARRSKPEAS